jgi:23S rRNA (adenine2030-N6)-methyltransferase
VKADYEAVVQALIRAHRRFATGVFLLWYPVIDRGRVQAMLGALERSRIRRQYRIELGTAPDAPGRGMTGSGLLVVNPPWMLPDAVAEGLPWLARHLKAAGPVESSWLVPE